METRTRFPSTVSNMVLYLVSQLKRWLDELAALLLERDNRYRLPKYSKVVAKMAINFSTIQHPMRHTTQRTLEDPIKINKRQYGREDIKCAIKRSKRNLLSAE